MGYKQIDPNMTLAEASLLGSMEHNRSLKRLENISEIIDWRKVEEILMSHYTVGTGREGADAYPPLMLLKGLLLQKRKGAGLSRRPSCLAMMGRYMVRQAHHDNGTLHGSLTWNTTLRVFVSRRWAVRS